MWLMLAGLRIAALGELLSSATEDAGATLASTPEGGDAVEALNTAFMTDGAVVSVAAGASVAKPLMIVFVRAGGHAHSVAVRNFVTVETGASATVIEAHVVLPGASHDAQLNALTEVTVGKGATLHHAKVAVDEGKALHLSNCDVTLDADATYRNFQFSTGLGFARNGLNIIFEGEGSKLDLSGAYLARHAEHIDTTLVVDHAVPRCESRELFKGVLDGHGRGVFQGKIIVRPGRAEDRRQADVAGIDAFGGCGIRFRSRNLRFSPTTSSAVTARRLRNSIPICSSIAGRAVSRRKRRGR